MNGSIFVFIQLLLEDQRLHVFGGLDLDQWDLTCSTSNAVLVTAAFKSLLSIQTFIPYTFYLPKSVVSEHYGGLFCQLGRSCLEKPEITFSYKKAAADIQKTIMFVTFYSTIAWCPFVGDEIHKNLVPASFENLEQNFWDLAR